METLRAKFPVWKVCEITNYEDPKVLLEGGAMARDKFVQEARFSPPKFLRVIDCKLSLLQEPRAVVIVDWPPVHDHFSGDDVGGYTAISHTYGQDVYEVFNCGCAADCRAGKPRADPAKCPCKGMHAIEDEDPGLQQRVIEDVLCMCEFLVEAGVRYAWQDGVCIAQHNPEEVKYFIQHIAWIYANADDTVIFLHYIGRPMFPIAPASYKDGPISRWQTRVWTFQEAALSKRRRYCVRLGSKCPLDAASDADEFHSRLASWYHHSSTEIIEEDFFFWIVNYIRRGLGEVIVHDVDADPTQLLEWQICLVTWEHLIWSLHGAFPTISDALDSCSSRESKHEGDRMNSILGLVGVKDFYAPKDERLEESTMQFFEKMGKAGLAFALFTTNKLPNPRAGERWFPTFSSPLVFTPSHGLKGAGPEFHAEFLELEVRREDSSLEIRGPLACVSFLVFLVVSSEMNEWAMYSSMFQHDDKRYLYANVDLRKTVSNEVWVGKDNRMVLLGLASRPTRSLLDEPTDFDIPQVDVPLAHIRRKGWGEGATFDDSLVGYCVFNLVFPAKVLELDFPGAQDILQYVDDTANIPDLWRSCSIPGVMVLAAAGGPVEKLSRAGHSWLHVPASSSNPSSQLAPVKKLGSFAVCPTLLHILRQDQHTQNYLTFLDTLVIA